MRFGRTVQMFLEGKLKDQERTLEFDEAQEAIEQLQTKGKYGSLVINTNATGKSAWRGEEALCTGMRARHIYDAFGAQLGDAVRVKTVHSTYSNNWGSNDFLDVEFTAAESGEKLASMTAEFQSGEPNPAYFIPPM